MWLIALTVLALLAAVFPWSLGHRRPAQARSRGHPPRVVLHVHVPISARRAGGDRDDADRRRGRGVVRGAVS